MVLVKWYKDNVVILEQTEELPKDGIFLMTFANLTEEDVGAYTCSIEYEGFTVQSNVVLIHLGMIGKKFITIYFVSTFDESIDSY